MAAKLVKPPPEVVTQARHAMSRYHYTPESLAAKLHVSTETVTQFLAGEPVETTVAAQFCRVLQLGPKPKTGDVAPQAPKELPQPEPPAQSPTAVVSPPEPPAVPPLSRSEEVERWCSQLLPVFTPLCDGVRLPDSPRPFSLLAIALEPLLYEDPPSQQRLEITDLLEACHPENLTPFHADGSLSISELPPRLARLALAHHPRAIVSGCLGTGKTSLLRWLTYQCLTGQWLPQCLPVYISLVDWLDAPGQPDLLTYLERTLQWAGVSLDRPTWERLGHAGHLFLALDGLDEVAPDAIPRLLRELNGFGDRFPRCHMVVAGRPVPYACQLRAFVELELAPWEKPQIQSFVQRWFEVYGSGTAESEAFGELLKRDRCIAEMSSLPLLLTLICASYGRRSRLFTFDMLREGFDLLLERWEASKGDRRSYHRLSGLSTTHKKDVLGQLAICALEHKVFFFEEAQLEIFWHGLMGTAEGLEYSLLAGSHLLSSFHVQHGLLRLRAKGIYSYSHLCFEEYAAAKHIALHSRTKGYQKLFQHLGNLAWRNVFVYLTNMLGEPDRFLLVMKEAVDALIQDDRHLRQYVDWAGQQGQTLKQVYKPVAITAMYLDIDFEKARLLDRARAIEIAHEGALDRARQRALGNDDGMDTQIDIGNAMRRAVDFDLAKDFFRRRICNLARLLEAKLDSRLTWLGVQAPHPERDKQKFLKWWEQKGEEWAKLLREAIVQPRKTIKDWEFTKPQLETLRRYHDANAQLVECLNSCRRLQAETRYAIESTLLVPPPPKTETATTQR
ncbi:MAG: NACHT domain-containing protein [Pseudanabaenaceae cyanobacterium]